MSDPDEIESQIGRRVRAVRTELGLRQRDVAERAGLSAETVSRIERGVQGVTFPNVARLADALEVPFAVICDLDVETDMLTATAKRGRLGRLLEDASTDQVELVTEVAETVLEWSGRPEED